MPNANELEICRVCGLYTPGFKPWGDDGLTPLFEICACCGVEFGYGDSQVSSARAFRERWIKEGAKWRFPEEKPAEWDLKEQLKNIPLPFR